MTSEIAKVTQSLTTVEEMRNHTKLLMQPYANWENYLTPAPLSIAIMGQLVFISSNTDFSINNKPPEGGYKYIRYPDSFRACLMQVCNSGWWAFNEAHKNMDQIRLHTMNVTDYMKIALKTLFEGNDEVVNVYLPDQLKNIGDIADECLALAESTENKFTDVIKIIQELLEACRNVEHVYGDKLEENKKTQEVDKIKKLSADEAVKRSERAAEMMEKELKEAKESYQQAMSSLPSGWNMIGMEFVAAVTESLTTIMNGLAFAVTRPMAKTHNSFNKMAGKQQEECSSADEFDQIHIFSKSAEIFHWAQNIQMFVQNDNIDWKTLYDQKNKKSNTDIFKEQFQRIKQNLNQIPSCKPNEQAQKICEDGIKICEELATYAQGGKCEDAKTIEMINKITELNESARLFDCESKNATRSPSFTHQPPMMFQEGSISQRVSENARFRIEQSRTQLISIREKYEKSVETMKNHQKELTDILVSMQQCELKEIDFNKTIEMLVKGMDAMGRVQEQWGKMVLFFQMVSNIVKTSLNHNLKDFVSTSEKAQSRSYSLKLFSKDLLYTQVSKACNIASLVHMISATYTEVSDKYLMDRISSLGKLMTMDKERPEFLHERLLLDMGCKEAQEGILQLVLQNKDEFERKTSARLETIDKELLAILPPAAPEEIKRIQETVKSGFTNEDAS